MKRYRKTGKGLLGIIDKLKKEAGTILAVIIIVGGYSLASAYDYEEAQLCAQLTVMEDPTEQEEQAKPNRTYYDVPLTKEQQDIIINIAERYEVDPALVLAVIEKESGYNPDATGDAGQSQGLMQVWRSAHEKRMEKLGAANLYDPYDNVIVGIDILAEKLASYKDVEKALIAYNAGDAGAKKLYFSKGIYSNSYSQAVMEIAERIRAK